MALKHSEVRERREKISMCLAKSITSPKAIEKETGIPAMTVSNDLKWMKKNSTKWLSGHALNGYVFETQQTIEQLRDIELELQKMRQDAKDNETKIKIIHELKDVINMRWVIQGDGPTLMYSKYVAEKARKNDSVSFR